MTTEFRRLGKPGAYRLGQLRAGGAAVERPYPFRPRFARPEHHWPVLTWLLGLLCGVALIAAGALAGLWFVPFAVGLLAGLANRVGRWPARAALPATALFGAAGWSAALSWSMLRGQADGAVARAVAVALGLPASAAVAVTLTVLVPAGLATAGYWLGRALSPLPAEN